ncbi:MAG: sensor histidine kinase [Chthoniobacterales bacterium]
MQSNEGTTNSGIEVAWEDVVRFLRQLSHDVRNHLNAVELQSAFLAELAADDELKEEVRRLRKMVSDTATALQKLTTRLNPPGPNLITYSASDFMEDLRTAVKTEFPKQADAIQWKLNVGQQTDVQMDPMLLRDAVLEVLRNAIEHQPAGSSLRFIGNTEGDNLVLTLYEPKTDFDLPTDNWGREPLRRVNRGHYGLGLNRARMIIEGQGGTLQAQYDPEQSGLITTIQLPFRARE